MSESPIEHLLEAIDRLDAEAVMRLTAPDVRLLTVDGHRAEGQEAVGELLRTFLGMLRSTAHRITAQWHVDNVWIAEVDASYELQDWLQIEGLPRVFVLRESQGAIADVRAYGAHERPLSEHLPGTEETRVGGRWIPPL